VRHSIRAGTRSAGCTGSHVLEQDRYGEGYFDPGILLRSEADHGFEPVWTVKNQRLKPRGARPYDVGAIEVQ
jgi:hypothetical protein